MIWLLSSVSQILIVISIAPSLIAPKNILHVVNQTHLILNVKRCNQYRQNVYVHEHTQNKKLFPSHANLLSLMAYVMEGTLRRKASQVISSK